MARNQTKDSWKKKNLTVPGSGTGRRMRVDDVTRERESWWQESREAVGGWSPGVGSWTGAEAVGGWRAERRQLRLDKREANREVGVDPQRGSQHQTPEQRGEETR